MPAKKIIGVLACGLLLGAMFAVSSYAATITFSSAAGRPGTYGGGTYGGGEFNASIDGGSLFQTFCLERNENLAFGTPYNFTVGMEAVNGGVGAIVPDPISSETAYLYRNFFDGTLPGYTGSASDQVGLQYAIWYFEEALTASDIDAAGLALAGTWITLANGTAIPDNFYGVQVINPYAGEVQKQSVLFIERIPEASALLLFGSGLIGLIGYRRTRRME